MKLLYAFFFLIVGAFAHPSKQDVEEETTKVMKSLPFMAIMNVDLQYIIIHKWAIILTEKWLLTSFNISSVKTIDITVRLYTDLFNTRGYEYEVESTSVLKWKEAALHPPFTLIELQSSINFGDYRKPIPLAGPNYEWQENEDAYYLNSNLKSIQGLSEIEYFKKFIITVPRDENRYESDLSDCLISKSSEDWHELECDPVIHNGTLIGFHIHAECENQPFLKINSIYAWILKNIPELQTTKYQILKEQNIIIKENFKWKSSLLQHFLPIQGGKIVNLMEFNNVTFNIQIDDNNEL